MKMDSEFCRKWFEKRRQHFIDSEHNSFECFLEEIEIGYCFPENEELAQKIIDTLKQRYNLIF